ncbi:hypothetical protein DEDE109153_08110 [Deinococcus deserti]|uniref:Uncharacterized protein n=1 Tax=Deinococcus deserti (strain DSM 17065 / CIP 109153 / LMG 22923 / VCD115) TaxID=546414 RepID=C1D3N4_DEIDV|nr:hypothetical protein [Deinococcus deserti]ACO48113.1 Hypothetical protein, precursor [Deinococcus deserti VCD115]
MKTPAPLLTLVLCTFALAQPGPTGSSSLLRLPLTPGAVRVTDPAATREFGLLLNTVAAGQGSGCQTSEYLAWNDADLAEQISDNLAAQLKARAISFKGLDEEEDEESYWLSFLLTEKQTRYVGVLYGDNESVVLGWCQLKAKVTVKPETPAPAKPAVPGPPKPAVVVQAPAPVPQRTTGAALAGDYVCLSGGAPELSVAGPVSQAPVDPAAAQIRSYANASKYRLSANGAWGDLTFGEKYVNQKGYKGTYRILANGDVDLLSDPGSRLYLFRPIPTTDRRLALVEVHQPADRYKAQFCTRVD